MLNFLGFNTYFTVTSMEVLVAVVRVPLGLIPAGEFGLRFTDIVLLWNIFLLRVIEVRYLLKFESLTSTTISSKFSLLFLFVRFYLRYLNILIGCL